MRMVILHSYGDQSEFYVLDVNAAIAKANSYNARNFRLELPSGGWTRYMRHSTGNWACLE